MSDWQVGDLALCVSSKHRLFASPSRILRAGRVYSVKRVGRPIDWCDGDRALALAGAVPDRGPGYGFPDSLFVKVTPPAADEFDRETIELMSGVEQPA